MRNAMIKYLMGRHGILDSYFNYGKINTYLEKPHKSYIKKIMCDPSNVMVDDFAELNRLTAEERCHVCILVMETKKRVELIYLSRMLSQLVHI